MICECVRNENVKWTPERLIELGFTQSDDGSGHPMGVDWDMKTDGYHLNVDPCGVVKLAQRNPDSDFITLHVCDEFALEMAIAFIQPYEGAR